MSYEGLVKYQRDTATAGTVIRQLTWDQQTFMPAGASGLRAKQLAFMSGLAHRRETAPEYRDLLVAAESEVAGHPADSIERANVREARHSYDRLENVPAELVEELATAQTLAHEKWIEARRNDDFTIFRPHLETIVGLVRRMAEAIGFEDHPYDALLDGYEPGATAADVRAVFEPLRDSIVDLLDRILGANRPATDVLRRHYPRAAQETFARFGAEAIGFDLERGRIDPTAHPFCGCSGPDDVRLTTRYNEEFLSESVFGLLHEAGHGIYEQGLDGEHYGTAKGNYCSLGIHESQSRMWENFVGRSLGFWKFAFPTAQRTFPDTLGNVTLDEFHRAVNHVEPGLIRIDADEVTYNLHIFLRMELEVALIGGELDVADLPDAWNDTFERYLRFRPPSNADGCLQDVHWGAALFGYFPTYTLGNVYGAQIYDSAKAALGDLDAAFARGEFTPLREWLNENIHAHGRHYRAKDLVRRVTGAPTSHEPLVRHLETKYSAIYGL